MRLELLAPSIPTQSLVFVKLPVHPDAVGTVQFAVTSVYDPLLPRCSNPAQLPEVVLAEFVVRSIRDSRSVTVIVAVPCPTTLYIPISPLGKLYLPPGYSTIPLAGFIVVSWLPLGKCKKMNVPT